MTSAKSLSSLWKNAVGITGPSGVTQGRDIVNGGEHSKLGESSCCKLAMPNTSPFGMELKMFKPKDNVVFFFSNTLWVSMK